jgi:nucleotide-binding universal stress UspA family protein
MYSNILIAADPDDPRSWSGALPIAASLARCLSASLTLCAVVRDVDAARQAEWSPIGYREMIGHARLRLATIAEQVTDLPVSIEIGVGTVCGGILDVAARVQADLIVLASHKPELKDYVMAANAARVARRAACSVLFVRESSGKAGPSSVAPSPASAG